MKFILSIFTLIFIGESACAGGFERKVADRIGRELKKTLTQNQLLLKTKKTPRFIIRMGVSLSDDRIENYDIVPGSQFLAGATLEDSLNDLLANIYSSSGIECYVVLMEYFDLKIQARPPPGWTLDDLFSGNKFFSENSIIDSLTKFQNKVGVFIKQAISASISRPIYLINLSRYNTVLYSGKPVSYYLSLHFKNQNPNATLPPAFNAVYADFLSRMQLVDAQTFRPTNEQCAIKSIATLTESVFKTNLQQKILSTYRVDSLMRILKYYDPNDIDYQKLSVQERTHCLSLFVGENMYSGSVNEPGEEDHAIQIVGAAPADQIGGLFNGLKSVSVLNADPSYLGDKSNSDALIARLLSGIDGDNYARFMRMLAELTQKRPDLPEMMNTLGSEENIQKRIYNWNETWLFGDLSVGHTQYDVSQESSGKIKVITKRVDAIINSTSSSGNVPVSSIIYANCPEVVLDPFDLVLFVNNSDLPAFSEAGADKGVPLFVPAIFLKYAEDKQFNNDAILVASITGDIATLAVAPLNIIKAVTWARRAWLAFECATALGNLSINTFGSGLPAEFQEVVGYSNLLMAAIGGKNILSGGYTTFTSALQGTKDLIQKVPRELAQNFARVLSNPDAYGQTLIQKLRALATTDQSAKAISLFYEKVKQIYRNAFKKDLETDLTPFPSYLPDWVKEIKTVEDYLAKIPVEYRTLVKEAFKDGLILKIPDEDIILIRHISANGNIRSGWYADEIMSPSNARTLLALPNNNTAEYIVKMKIRKGTPYLYGEVTSQASNSLFGNYATGGGKQYYLLKEFYQSEEIVQLVDGPLHNTAP